MVSPDDLVFFYLQSIVLENLSFSFLKPNILDIKLGTVLYDETASPEKVARMQKTAQETTSLETGVRLTGFQVSSLACRSLLINFPCILILNRSMTTSPAKLFIRQNRTANPSKQHNLVKG